MERRNSQSRCSSVVLPPLAPKSRRASVAPRTQSKLQPPGGDGEKRPPTPEVEQTRLEDQFTNDKLRKLQAIFQAADEDGGGGLDMEEFRVAMRTTLGDSSLTDSELDMIFMKVDTNCDGTVDLDEYLTYMLLECREKDIMSVEARQPFPRDATSVSADHRDSIIRLQFMPSVGSGNVIDENRGRYLAVSQEGIISFWSPDWNYLFSRKVEPISPKAKNVWVTDLVCMPSSHTIVLATTNRDVVFFDISGNRFTRMSRITRLPACCMCLKFYMSATRGFDSFLLWGDDQGGITAVRFLVPLLTTQLNPKRSKTGRERFPFDELREGLIPKVKLLHLENIHGESVKALEYSHHLSCFISCSKDTESAMVVGDLEQKTMSYYFSVTRGINSFEYSKKLNVIATGGFDGVVRVWNPYVTAKPIILLSDHKSAIICVHISALKEHIISIAENKEIRVHDLNTQTCIQTFYRKMLPDLGTRAVSASYFHPKREALCFATVSIAVLEQRAEDMKLQRLWSHVTPVTAVRYNPLFRQVVSASLDSLVCVWNVYTGEKAMQFTAHTIQRNGQVINVEVTAIDFDTTYRRLFTALRGGMVKVWNFNNGACLRELPVYDKGKEITSIVFPECKIVTAGWNKRLTIYVDDSEDDTTKFLKRVHEDDILSLALCPSNMVASSSYDGQVCVWSLDTYRLVICTRLPQFGATVAVADTVWSQKHVPPADIAPTLEEGGLPKMMEQRAIEKLLYIKNRELHPETANLLGACADGYVRAWSVHHKGSLRGQFLASSRPGVCVTMAITKDFEWLVTGDSTGYIRTWDIHVYCVVGNPEAEPDREELYKPFPCREVLAATGVETSRGAFTLLDGAAPPVLVNAYRGHLKGVTALDLAEVEGETLIVTSSMDCSVRLWTFHGEAVGIFGRQTMWSARKMPGGEVLERGYPTPEVDPHDVTAKGCLIPPDVRRVASAKTLRVYKSGRHPMWALTKNILLWFCRFTFGPPKEEEVTLPVIGDLQHSHDGLSRSVSKRDSIQANTLMGSDGERESVLGKSYKPSTKHRPAPALRPPPGTIGTQCAAYHYLPFPDTSETPAFDTGVIADIKERYSLTTPNEQKPLFRKVGWKTAHALNALTKKESRPRKRSEGGRGVQRVRLSLAGAKTNRRGSIFISDTDDGEEDMKKERKNSIEQSSLGTISEA